MLDPEKTKKHSCQNKLKPHTSKKHEVNLQKNSTLYFQIGLIICFLLALTLLEMRFETKKPKVLVDLFMGDPHEIPMVNFTIYKEPIAQSKPKPKRKVAFVNKIKPVDNSDNIDLNKKTEIAIVKKDLQPNPNLQIAIKKSIAKPQTNKPISLLSAHKIPIYPGCDKNLDNEQLKKCMSEKIASLIKRKFDGDYIASKYGLKGKQKIYVQFTIDKNGKVNNVRTNSKYPKLDKEAIRVINFIPEMEPAKQNNKNVGVIYNLPIVFQVL